MKKVNPALPTGVRDFGPIEVQRRNYIINIIKSIFESYGYEPLETPTFEKLEILSSKYGEEGDQLMFKILNSGDFKRKLNDEDFSLDHQSLSWKICERALRYDLTLPLARYISMNAHKHTFPFRRYQIQPVWRADRPQKGRYREFYQCDVDVVGHTDLTVEVEYMNIIHQTLNRLSIPKYTIKFNHRRLLEFIAYYLDRPELFSELCIQLDKKDKIGKDKLYANLRNLDFSDDSINRLDYLLEFTGSSEELLYLLESRDISDEYKETFNDLRQFIRLLNGCDIPSDFYRLDIGMARGLSYYTGLVFEGEVPDSGVGSICAGGRYDNLTSLFGMKETPGVGFSFGLDRLYQVLLELDAFPGELTKGTEVLLSNLAEEALPKMFSLGDYLRNSGITVELYSKTTSLKKQLSYADKKNIKFMVIFGTEEIKSSNFILKNMITGHQFSFDMKDYEVILESMKK